MQSERKSPQDDDLPRTPPRHTGQDGEEVDPVYDLTQYAPHGPFVLCKIPRDIYDEVEKLVQSPPPKPKKGDSGPGSEKKKKKVRIKGTWTKEEDETLLKLVEKYGAKKWPNIALKMRGRNGKQCRERFLNHLDDSINHGEWAKEEDELIIKMHGQSGNQWAKMARLLKGRPANKIKNRWNSTLSKIVNQKPVPTSRGGMMKPRGTTPTRKRRKKAPPERMIPPPILVSDQQEIKLDEPSPSSAALHQLERSYNSNHPRRSRRVSSGNPYSSNNYGGSPTSQNALAFPVQYVPPPPNVHNLNNRQAQSKVKSFVYPISSDFTTELMQRIGRKRERNNNNNNNRQNTRHEPPLKKRKSMHSPFNPRVNSNGSQSPRRSFAKEQQDMQQMMTPSKAGLMLDLNDGGNITTPSQLPMSSLQSPPFFRQGGSDGFLPVFDGEDLTSLFPSPVNLEEKKNDTYKKLIEHNQKTIRERNKHGSGFMSQKEEDEIARLDAKLGIGVEELKDNSMSGMYQQDPNFGNLMLNPDDSALFASDYGITLSTPSHLSVGIWSPKLLGSEGPVTSSSSSSSGGESENNNKELIDHPPSSSGEAGNGKSLLRINVHPIL